MGTLKDLRIKKGLTQKEVADYLGVKPSVVSRYENGQVTPPPKKKVALAKLFEIPYQAIEYIGNDSMMEMLIEYQPQSGRENRLDLYRRMIILANSGCCELCNQPAPFKDSDGRPYLQLLEIRDEQENLLRGLKNYVVLCPNCYQKEKILNEKEDLLALEEKAEKHNF